MCRVVVRCLWFVGCRSLFAVGWLLLFVVCCLLIVGCCLWFVGVVCCLVFAV